MAAKGRKVEEVIPCSGMGEGEALTRLVEAVAGEGSYKAVQVAHNRLQFARTFRPTWALVTGWITVWLACTGALFFFVKTTETCLAVIETDHTGTRIRLSGVLSSEVLGRISAAFGAEAAPMTVGLSSVGAPSPTATAGPSLSGFEPASTANAPSSLGPNSVLPTTVGPPAAPPTTSVSTTSNTAPPVPTGQAQPASAPSFSPPPMAPPSRQSAPPSPDFLAQQSAPKVNASPLPPLTAPSAPSSTPGGVSFDWGAAAAEADSNEFGGAGYVPRGPSTPIVESSLSLTPVPVNGSDSSASLDDGTSLELGENNLFGRDPVTDGTIPGVKLFPVIDPTKSVSKTHFALNRRDGAWWLEDLHSTNGVSIVDPSGFTIADLQPGSPTRMPDGPALIRFGERTLRLGRA